MGERAADFAHREMTSVEPAAGFGEHHRQRAVEHAGSAQILEIELREERCGIHAPNREGEPPLPVLGEIEHGRLQPQLTAGERPASATDLDLRGAEEAIADHAVGRRDARRSEEHTSELQSLMRISYAVFCLKKKT